MLSRHCTSDHPYAYFYLMMILFKLSMFIFFEIDMPPRTRGGYTSSAPRRRPTGSERRRRVELREVEPAADPDSVEHPQHDRDEHEEVFEGAPGGPIDICILRSFDKHIAAKIWLDEVNNHCPKLYIYRYGWAM